MIDKVNKLKGNENGIHAVGDTFFPLICGGNIIPNSKGGMAIVGVIRIS